MENGEIYLGSVLQHHVFSSNSARLNAHLSRIMHAVLHKHHVAVSLHSSCMASDVRASGFC